MCVSSVAASFMKQTFACKKKTKLAQMSNSDHGYEYKMGEKITTRDDHHGIGVNGCQPVFMTTSDSPSRI